MAKETYVMAKKTYDMAKETNDMAKETYDMAKETYDRSLSCYSSGSLLTPGRTSGPPWHVLSLFCISRSLLPYD